MIKIKKKCFVKLQGAEAVARQEARVIDAAVKVQAAL